MKYQRYLNSWNCNISGCLVTIDAMSCQKKIAQKILDKKADYLLAIKGNQGRLKAAFEEFFILVCCKVMMAIRLVLKRGPDAEMKQGQRL